MRKRKQKILSLFLILIAVYACSNESEIRDDSNYGSMPKKAGCFNTMDIRDYRILDRGNLIVYGRPKSRSYHLQVSPPNLDDGGMDMISFNSFTGRVCGFAGDELIIPDNIFPERFSIMSVTELDETAHYNLMVRFGKAEPIQEIEPGADSSPQITRELDEGNKKEDG
jgi:hypothetical protein